MQPNPLKTADLVTFTEEIQKSLMENLIFYALPVPVWQKPKIIHTKRRGKKYLRSCGIRLHFIKDDTQYIKQFISKAVYS